MDSLTSVLFILIIKLVSCKDCVLDNGSVDLSWEVKLHKDVTTSKCVSTYDPPPSNSSDPLKVSLQFRLKFFKFSANEETFMIYSWLDVKWMDERLQWDPKDYGEIDNLKLSSHEIWSPALQLFNTLDEDQMDFLYAKCIVKFTGRVRCTTRLSHEAICNTELKNWPYDVQNCTLYFGEWNKPRTHVRFNLKSIAMFGAEYGAGWTIIAYNVRESDNDTTHFSLSIVLERVADGLAAVIVVPSIILAVLTLTTLFLKADNLRVFLSCLSLLLHYYILIIINAEIPKHSEDTPLILLFVRGSSIITLTAILLSLSLIFMQILRKPTPEWILTLNNYVFNSKVKYIIYPRWENKSSDLTLSENLVENQNRLENWSDFTNILNSMFVFIFLLCYLIMYLVYMPKALPNTDDPNIQW